MQYFARSTVSANDIGDESTRGPSRILESHVVRRPSEPKSEHQELVEQLRRELAALPEQQAAAFALRWIDGMTNEEIAEQLQITINHVGVLLHRARTTLQHKLTSEGVHER